MKRTRRAALLLMAASSSALAAETLGFSQITGRRDVRADVVDDETAYLGLTEDGLEAGGVLFEGGARTSPATFAVVNQLPEPIAVSLESDAFRFRTTDDAAAVDGGRLSVGAGSDALDPGERLAGIVVEPKPDAIAPAAGSAIRGTVAITAEGEDTRIAAERDLALEPRGISVDRARLEMSRAGRDRFEHRWLLTGVETTTHGLEALRFDYRDVETAGAIDFTAGPSPSASVAVGETTRAAAVERRRPNRLTVGLEEPLPIDGGDVAVVLTETGPPASPGGAPGRPCGATVELLDAGFSARVEGIRR